MPAPTMGTDHVRRKARSLEGVEPADLRLVELVMLPPYHYGAMFPRAPFQGERIVATNIA
jgi:hypothetical protein